MIEKLRSYHKLGRVANADHVVTREFASEHGLSASTIRKARDFARKYSVAEVTELCRLVRPNGLPLHWGYVLYLLTVPRSTVKQRRERAKLQDEAARAGWSAPRLYHEIRRRFRPEGLRKGGRPLRKFADSAEWLVEARLRTEALVNILTALDSNHHSERLAAKPTFRSSRFLRALTQAVKSSRVALRQMEEATGD